MFWVECLFLSTILRELEFIKTDKCFLCDMIIFNKNVEQKHCTCWTREICQLKSKCHSYYWYEDNLIKNGEII